MFRNWTESKNALRKKAVFPSADIALFSADFVPTVFLKKQIENFLKGDYNMDIKALFKISYGLYVVASRENEKDNGSGKNR